LPNVPLTGEESSIRVLPNVSLYIITLTPLSREEFIFAQKSDEGMAYLRRRLLEGDPKVNWFHEDAEGTVWFKDILVVPKKEALKKKILDALHEKHTAKTRPYEKRRCTDHASLSSHLTL
jgi:hypothetical protein